MGVPRLSFALACALGLGGCARDAGDVAVSAVELRPDDPDAGDLPESFSPDASVEILDGEQGAVRVHYTLEGRHAIPREDTDDDGVPDYASDVAREYEASLELYTTELGMIPPLADGDAEGNNGGDAKLDVYLVDFPTGADGAFRRDGCLAGEPDRCFGHMIHENDFDGRSYPSLAVANRTVASHELFHAVQHAYDASAGVVVSEGSAVWASEAYAPELQDFELLIGGYFERPERSLAQEPTGPVDAFSYGSAIFFRFLEERFGREVIGQLWEQLRSGAGDTAWPAALDAVLRAEHDSSLADAYAELVRWNLYTGDRADASEAYAEGARYPQLSERDETLPYFDDRVRVFPLAARYIVADVEEAGEVYLEATENEASLAGLRLLLAVESAGSITAIESGTIEDASRIAVQVERGQRVHAALLNTQPQGESLQPRVCFARTGDDATCGGMMVDAGGVESDAGEPVAAASSSSGCAVAVPRHGSGVALGALAFVLVLGLITRKNRAN